jgi:hypothetical protein
LLAAVGGACTTDADNVATPSNPGDLCDELDATYEASQEANEGWTGDDIRRAAEGESEQVRDAVASFATVVERLQEQFNDGPSAPSELTPAEWATASNVLAWWQYANCDSRSMSWDIHDPALNPSGLTEAVPLTNDGAPPQLVPSENEAVISPGGSVVSPGDVELKNQQTVTMYADVDRRCFAIGEYVAAAQGDYNNPGAEAEHLAAVADAGTRKSCLSGPVAGSSRPQVRWTGDYNGWTVQVVETERGTPLASGSERVWELTEDLYVVATPPTA